MEYIVTDVQRQKDIFKYESDLEAVRANVDASFVGENLPTKLILREDGHIVFAENDEEFSEKTSTGFDTLADYVNSLQVKPNLIALVGPATVGKTYESSRVEQYVRVSLADVVKQESKRWVVDVFGEAKYESLVEIKENIRPVYNHMGSLLRHVDPDFIKKHLFNLVSENEHVIIDDVAFDEEISMIHKFGGTVLYIDRPNTFLDQTCRPQPDFRKCDGRIHLPIKK